MLKRNFLIDYSQTMDQWDDSVSPFDSGEPQAVPRRRGQDPLRRDYGSLYMPHDGRWNPPAAGLVRIDGRPQAPNALISKYYYKTQQYGGRSLAAGGEPPTYTPENSNPEPSSVSPTERHGAGSDAYILAGGYDELSTYGFIHQKIRIEANRDLLPNRGELIPGLTSDVGTSPDRATIADVDAWRNWCIQNYYGREVRREGSIPRGTFHTYVEHSTTYDSPYTPREKSFSPNDRQAASVDFEYNFYINKYETGIQNEPADSQTIYPHLYTMYFEKSRQLGVNSATDVSAYEPTILNPLYNENYIYSDFVTLNRSLEEVFINSMRFESIDSFAGFAEIPVRREKAGEIDRVRYFEKWMASYNEVYNPLAGSTVSPTTLDGLQVIKDKYRNILLTVNAAQESQTYNLYKELFPMISEVKIPLAYPQFMNQPGFSLAAGPGLARPSTVARVWDGVYASRHGSSSEYVFDVNFAEIHQGGRGGGEFLSTPNNLSNGTRRTVFDLGEMFKNLGGSRSAPGGNVEFVNNFVSFRTAIGATIGEDPAGIDIETNIDEAPDDRILNVSGDVFSYEEFVEQTIEALQALTQQYLRSYVEMIEFAPAFTCPLFYRINKYQRVNGQRGARIQSVIVPQYTARKGKIFEYIDTQLKYENSYEYEVLINNIIIGSKYKFTELYLPYFLEDGSVTPNRVEYYGPSDLASRPQRSWRPPPGGDINVDGALATLEPDRYAAAGMPPARATTVLGGIDEPASLEGTGGRNPFFAEIDVVVEPSIVVVETPFIATGLPWNEDQDQSFGVGTVLDDPGISPNVRVIPYRGVDDKIMFNLETGIGQQYNVPISISSNEEQYYARLQENSDGENGPLVFYENDDPAAAFEIYRISSHPATYRDFENNMIANISTNDKLIGYRRGASVSYVDDIKPNVKYYYMFRSRDIHNHYSYPSEIYEVEMIEDAGAVYPRVRVVDPLQDQRKATPQKNLKRFLQIKPQLSQRLFNVSETFAPLSQNENASAPVTDNIALGNRAEKIWDRKFKIRLTSKKSGKKIDLNVTFKKEYSDQRSDSEEDTA
jgi:hypothetical protein